MAVPPGSVSLWSETFLRSKGPAHHTFAITSLYVFTPFVLVPGTVHIHLELLSLYNMGISGHSALNFSMSICLQPSSMQGTASIGTLVYRGQLSHRFRMTLFSAE